jgi:hypothetical protein
VIIRRVAVLAPVAVRVLGEQQMPVADYGPGDRDPLSFTA